MNWGYFQEVGEGVGVHRVLAFEWYLLPSCWNEKYMIVSEGPFSSVGSALRSLISGHVTCGQQVMV